MEPLHTRPLALFASLRGRHTVNGLSPRPDYPTNWKAAQEAECRVYEVGQESGVTARPYRNQPRTEVAVVNLGDRMLYCHTFDIDEDGNEVNESERVSLVSAHVLRFRNTNVRVTLPQ